MRKISKIADVIALVATVAEIVLTIIAIARKLVPREDPEALPEE